MRVTRSFIRVHVHAGTLVCAGVDMCGQQLKSVCIRLSPLYLAVALSTSTSFNICIYY